MAKVFRPSSRESTILSKIESQKEHTRRLAINGIKDCIDPLSNSIAMKLIDDDLCHPFAIWFLSPMSSACF
jgi:hypothetical protein